MIRIHEEDLTDLVINCDKFNNLKELAESYKKLDHLKKFWWDNFMYKYNLNKNDNFEILQENNEFYIFKI